MSKPQNHPSPAVLSAYSLGQLSEPDAERIDDHISRCEPCCETIAGMSDEDTFVGLLQQAEEDRQENSKESESQEDTFTAEVDIPTALSGHPRYEVIEVAGQGGMGRVYKARHRMMDRTVALKVIHREWVRRKEAIDRFRREVQAAASLDHRNIVTAHDAEEAGGLHFLVMEYVDGVDLAEVVRSQGPLSVNQACDYIRQGAEGLVYAHECGMVHRDIKPHNLMVTGDHVVKILDFGLASFGSRAATEDVPDGQTGGDLTLAGAVMGTPDFISPEQAQDARRADGRSDVYSLGMTLYYLLAGRVPFEGGTPATKLKQHAEEVPRPLGEFRDDIPEALQGLIDRMTAKRPEDRMQSPQEVATALSSFLKVHTGHGLSKPHSLSSPWSSLIHPITVVLTVTLLAAACLVIYGRNEDEAERDIRQLGVYLRTGESSEFHGNIADRLLRTEEGRRLLRKLDAETPRLTYTEGQFAYGYTSALIYACENSESESSRAELMIKGRRLGTAGTATRSVMPGISLQSVRFDNAPDDSCRVVMEYTTGDETVFLPSDRLRRSSLYRSSVGLRELFDARGATSEVWESGELVGPALKERIPLGSSGPVESRMIIGKTLSMVRSADVRWVFTGTGVRLSHGGREIPVAVAAEVLGTVESTELIAAKWELREKGTVLRLRDIRADGQPLGRTVDLTISRAGHIRMNIGSHQYNIAESAEADQSALRDSAAPMVSQDLSTEGSDEQGSVTAEAFSQMADDLLQGKRPYTEAAREANRQIAVRAWSLCLSLMSEDVARAIMSRTKPEAGIRISDRMAASGRPTEPLGWGIQAVYGMALAHAGDTDAALAEVDALLKKLTVNIDKGRLPNLTFSFLGKQRSQHSLRQQLLLHKAMVLALAGKTVEATDQLAQAGSIRVDRELLTEDDTAAIQEVLSAVADLLEASSGELGTGPGQE